MSGEAGISGLSGKSGISGLSGKTGLAGPTYTKKMPGPSVFKTRGARASKGGGDLLSRIALQYHRRWRA